MFCKFIVCIHPNTKLLMSLINFFCKIIKCFYIEHIFSFFTCIMVGTLHYAYFVQLLASQNFQEKAMSQPPINTNHYYLLKELYHPNYRCRFLPKHSN